MNPEQWLNAFKESLSRFMNGKPDELRPTVNLHLRDPQQGSIRSALPQEHLDAYERAVYQKRSTPDEHTGHPDNPLFHPHRQGEAFVTAFYRILDSLHVHDPREVALLRLGAAMAELRLSREPGQWARDEVLHACECGIVRKNPLPRGSTANKTDFYEHHVQELFPYWRHRYDTDDEARQAVESYLEKPLRPSAGKELVALVAPLCDKKEDAQEWVAQYLGIDWETVRKF